MSAEFSMELRVRYGECDPQGIVFNANYLLYADVAFTELWREAVGPWLEMLEEGVDAVVAHAELDFRGPARYDDVLTLAARIVRLGNSAITTEIDVRREDEVLVAMRLRHVCVSTRLDPDTMAFGSTPWPDAIRRGLERFVVPPLTAPP